MDSSRSRCSHCLRPEFTYSLADRLICGESINLISPHGQGRRRTLEDLCRFLPGSTMAIQINMRFYCLDFKGFLKAIGTYFNHPADRVSSLGALFDQLEKENRNVLLILHNFDELWSGKALKDGYSPAFIDDLNRLREREITLLCVTEQRDAPLQAGGTILDAAPLPLPEITKLQLLRELQHRSLPVEKSELPVLAEWLLNQKSPYSQLDTFDTKWYALRMWQKK